MPKPRIELATYSIQSNRANHCATLPHALQQSGPIIVSLVTRLMAVQP